MSTIESVPVVRYKPFVLRRPDSQYQALLSRLLNEGEETGSAQGVPRLAVVNHGMTFDLSNGIPVITERDVVSGKHPTFYQALGELCAFLNGARTQEELESFGCFWWKRWVTAEKCVKRGLQPGDLGPGSYGPAWTAFPNPNGKPFNQIQHVVEQMRERPELITHIVSPFIRPYLGRGKGKTQEVVVVPCHGLLFIYTNPRTRELSLHHIQRSCDVPVGLAGNLVQYAALTMMFAQVLGYTARTLHYTISSAQCYHTNDHNPETDQRVAMREMLSTKPQQLATVRLNPAVTDIFAFRKEDFTIHDYYPQSERRPVWTPV